MGLIEAYLTGKYWGCDDLIFVQLCLAYGLFCPPTSSCLPFLNSFFPIYLTQWSIKQLWMENFSQVGRSSKWFTQGRREGSLGNLSSSPWARNHSFLPKGSHTFFIFKIVSVNSGKTFSRATEVLFESFGKLRAFCLQYDFTRLNNGDD